MSTRWTIEDLKRRGLKISEKGNFISKIDEKNTEINQKFPDKPASFALGRMKAGKMNKTERHYADHLEALKMAGEVLWYEFEPMNLRLADNCFYKIDFLVMIKSGQLECHEVKGFWTDDALVKIKIAAEKFPFRFISVMLKNGNWEVREF